MRKVKLEIEVEVSDDAEWLTVDVDGEPSEHFEREPRVANCTGWASPQEIGELSDNFPLRISNWRDLKINLKKYFEKENPQHPFRVGDLVSSKGSFGRDVHYIAEVGLDRIKVHGDEDWWNCSRWEHFKKPEKPEPVIKKGEIVNHVMTALPVFLKQTYEGSIGRVVATVVEEYLAALEKKIDASR